jgi:hypothetical protein
MGSCRERDGRQGKGLLPAATGSELTRWSDKGTPPHYSQVDSNGCLSASRSGYRLAEGVVNHDRRSTEVRDQDGEVYRMWSGVRQHGSACRCSHEN